MMPVKKTTSWLPGILNDFLGNEWIAKVNATAPAVNIIESQKGYKVEIAAPGIAKDDFKITVNDDHQLIVSTEVKNQSKEENEDKHEKYLRREFSYAQFQQTMILPENVDKNAISAKQENGVLVICIPKLEQPVESKTKEIEVK
jgi:HSP20 family protein